MRSRDARIDHDPSRRIVQQLPHGVSVVIGAITVPPQLVLLDSHLIAPHDAPSARTQAIQL